MKGRRMKKFSAAMLLIIMILPVILLAQTKDDQAKTRLDEIMKELTLKKNFFLNSLKNIPRPGLREAPI
jgi:hypothetical protein